MLDSDFLAAFKRATEAKWNERSVDPTLYGFQFQPGTRWNPGLSAEQIAEYEGVLRVQFPHDFKAFLRAMNGTDIPTLNVYGNSGYPPRQSVGVYSYPRDMGIVEQQIENVRECRVELGKTLSDQGFVLPAEASLVPIYGSRYLVCTSDPNSSVVLSIEDGADAIVYGDSLKGYLEREFL